MSGARSGWRVDALIVAVCALAFAPAMTAGFIRYDDPLYVLRNEALAQGLSTIWSPARAWEGRFLEYFPLRDTVYWLLFRLAGLDALAYHLTSLAFHALASVLALRLASALGLSRFAAVSAALLFAVHPIHIESVAWAAGLKDPMYTAALFGSVLAFQRFRESGRAALWALSLALFIAALLTKSMALSLPLILVALERRVGTPTPWVKLMLRVAPFVLLAGLALVHFVFVGRANDIVLGPHGGSWTAHLVLTAWAQVKYLQQALVPASFRLIYCFTPPSGLFDLRLLLALGLASLVGVALWAWRARPWILFAAAWYGACLLPVSNLVPFPAVMADRYLYAAVFGLCLLAGVALETLSKARLVLGAMVATLTLTCAARSTLWHDEEALWAESDEDPACLVDPSPAAVDAHLLRAAATKDGVVKAAALDRALASAGLERSKRRCQALEDAARVAAMQSRVEPAQRWGREAVLRCPSDAESWQALAMALLAAKDPEASTAAQRAWIVAPSTSRSAFFELTTSAFGVAGAFDRLEGLHRQHPDEVCPVLRDWKQWQPADARVDALLRACPAQ